MIGLEIIMQDVKLQKRYSGEWNRFGWKHNRSNGFYIFSANSSEWENDIKISYTLVNGATINTHLYIEATQPKLIRLKADCKEKHGFQVWNCQMTI